MARRIGVILVLIGLLLPAAAQSSAAKVKPPANTDPVGLRHCSSHGPVTKACLKGALQDFNRARAREGITRMALPTDFARLSVPGQLLVLADIDRVDRGLRPVTGLSSTLQAYAQAGAAHGGDPEFPSWTRQGGSNWASPASSLWAEFLWMYDDGPGSSNIDCPSAHAHGCYGHRDNILNHYRSPVLMGAGVDGHGGVTQLFLGGDRHDRADVLTWTSQRRLIPVGVSAHRLRRGGTVTVSASGRDMNVRFHASQGYRLSRKGCHLKAGHDCAVAVRGAGRGTLTLTGPNGTVVVELS